MSFSTETKTELINQPIHKKCCRKALLAGLIFDGETDGNGRMIAVFSNEECALFASKILSLEGYTVPYKPVRSAPNRYELAFTSESNGALARFPQELGIKLCAECVPSFVRGLLISKCSITDPEKQYHFEMLFEHSENAEKLMSFFEDLFGTPLLASRKNGVGLVYKNSSVIEDILSVAGATSTGAETCATVDSAFGCVFCFLLGTSYKNTLNKESTNQIIASTANTATIPRTVISIEYDILSGENAPPRSLTTAAN